MIATRSTAVRLPSGLLQLKAALCRSCFIVAVFALGLFVHPDLKSGSALGREADPEYAYDRVTASRELAQFAQLDAVRSAGPGAVRTVESPGPMQGPQAYTIAAQVEPKGTELPAPTQRSRIHLPVFSAAGILEADERPIRLAGIAVTPANLQCGSGTDAWPCGRVAQTALRRFIGRRAVECLMPSGSHIIFDVAQCSVGGTDISEWLVAQGWAKAEGPQYSEVEKAARNRALGIWNPIRPGLPWNLVRSGEVQAPALSAAVRAEVVLSSQTMTLIHRGRLVGQWPVSTARQGKVTPTGSWTAQWLSRNHRSSLYGNAPMPYSVFFNGDYAVHGTDQIGRLGEPASAGCIRLHPSHAAILFELAREEGLKNTVIIVRR